MACFHSAPGRRCGTPPAVLSFVRDPCLRLCGPSLCRCWQEHFFFDWAFPLFVALRSSAVCQQVEANGAVASMGVVRSTVRRRFAMEDEAQLVAWSAAFVAAIQHAEGHEEYISF